MKGHKRLGETVNETMGQARAFLVISYVHIVIFLFCVQPHPHSNSCGGGGDDVDGDVDGDVGGGGDCGGGDDGGESALVISYVHIVILLCSTSLWCSTFSPFYFC